MWIPLATFINPMFRTKSTSNGYANFVEKKANTYAMAQHSETQDSITIEMNPSVLVKRLLEKDKS